MYKKKPVRPSDFSAKILQARREWHDKVLKGKKNLPRILYPAKLLFQIEIREKEFSRQAKAKGTHHH